MLHEAKGGRHTLSIQTVRLNLLKHGFLPIRLSLALIFPLCKHQSQLRYLHLGSTGPFPGHVFRPKICIDAGDEKANKTLERDRNRRRTLATQAEGGEYGRAQDDCNTSPFDRDDRVLASVMVAWWI